MAGWEQFEVWVREGGKWQMIAAFHDFDVASAVARNRSSEMRLIHAVYQNGKLVSQDVLAELGATRTR